MPTLDAQGRTLHFLDEGSGEPALLLHSGGLSSRQWRGLASQLRQTHRVLVPDLLGYGGSSRLEPGAQFHFRDDVEMLAALLDTLEGPVHLVGHSYGGLLALQLGLRGPERVRSLALFEPVAFGVLHGAAAESAGAAMDAAEATEMHRLASDDKGRGGGEAWMEGFVDWWQGAGTWRALPEPSRQAFLASGRKTFLEVVSLLADRTPAERYASLTAPALLLVGERSPALEHRVCARLAQALAHARLEVIPKAGHMGPLTHMSLVNALIAAHLRPSPKTVEVL
jgi:pimeloyl-ACP methyl ester carboxylesterase